MSRSYSEDLRQRIVNAVDGGISRRQAAEHYNVSVSSAIRYARRWRETGSVQAAAMGAPRRSKLDPHADWLLAQIDEAPDLTLEEIIARLGSERGVKSSIGGLWNFFHRHAISFKKTAHAAEQDRPDVAENRRVWRARQPALDPTRLVFIDETGANTKMARLRGRCRRGQRLVAAVPHGHWKTMTFIAGLRHDGITAPFVVDRPMNGVIFRLWVERCLVPTSGARRYRASWTTDVFTQDRLVREANRGGRRQTFPIQAGPLDFHGPSNFVNFSFEQANDAFGEGIVIGISHSSHGWINAGISQSFAVLNG